MSEMHFIRRHAVALHRFLDGTDEIGGHTIDPELALSSIIFRAKEFYPPNGIPKDVMERITEAHDAMLTYRHELDQLLCAIYEGITPPKSGAV